MSSREGGTEPASTLTLHFLHVPWPPHVESIAMPFQLAASNTVTPGGTRTARSEGTNESCTRPVPSCTCRPASAGGSRRPSRR